MVFVLDDLPGTVTVTEQVLFSPAPSIVMFVWWTQSPPVCLVTAAPVSRVEIISRIAVLTEHSKPIASPLH